MDDGLRVKLKERHQVEDEKRYGPPVDTNAFAFTLHALAPQVEEPR